MREILVWLQGSCATFVLTADGHARLWTRGRLESHSPPSAANNSPDSLDLHGREHCERDARTHSRRVCVLGARSATIVQRAVHVRFKLHYSIAAKLKPARAVENHVTSVLAKLNL